MTLFGGGNIQPPLHPAALGDANMAVQQLVQNEEQLSRSAFHRSEFVNEGLGLCYLIKQVGCSLIYWVCSIGYGAPEKKLNNETYSLF